MHKVHTDVSWRDRRGLCSSLWFQPRWAIVPSPAWHYAFPVENVVTEIIRTLCISEESVVRICQIPPTLLNEKTEKGWYSIKRHYIHNLIVLFIWRFVHWLSKRVDLANVGCFDCFDVEVESSEVPILLILWAIREDGPDKIIGDIQALAGSNWSSVFAQISWSLRGRQQKHP